MVDSDVVFLVTLPLLDAHIYAEFLQRIALLIHIPQLRLLQQHSSFSLSPEY